MDFALAPNVTLSNVLVYGWYKILYVQITELMIVLSNLFSILWWVFCEFGNDWFKQALMAKTYVNDINTF